MDLSRFLQALRQGCVDPVHASRLHGGKGGGPPAPDYYGNAQAQQQQNTQAGAQSTLLSNPNVTNPYGTQRVSYTWDPTLQGWSPHVVQNLSPVGQQRFDQDQRINQGLGGIAEQGLGYVKDTLNTPFDTSSLPERSVNAGETGQEAILRRLEPQIQQDREMMRTQLTNQGLAPGGEAWDNAYRVQNQRENDLRSQAALQGIAIGDTARDKAIQEQSFLRMEPLNTLNAVRSGAPVGIPQFQQWQGANIAGAPLFNAAQAQGQFDVNKYGIRQGGQNNMMSGLFGLGSSAMGMWGGG
jgi:hypothetical protein